MEGVTDAPMREFITRTGLFDYCVSEFIRVSGHVVPAKVFLRDCPELGQKAKTTSGILVQVQLLGGDPERLAQSALEAVLAGACGIDLNFGCPAPTVNRHDGGATLLKYPDRLEKIVRAVRDAVPAHLPVSAKMRLGFDDPKAIYENARRAEQGGASWIAIHGRTKTQGYQPPAYWKPIGEVKRAVSVPVIANGEIFTIEDFRRCREETGAIHFMIGRGALANPILPRLIRKELGLDLIPVPNPVQLPEDANPKAWALAFAEYALVQPSEKRIKQWVRYIASKQKVTWWDTVKVLGSVTEILNHLSQLPEVQSCVSPTEEHQSQTELS